MSKNSDTEYFCKEVGDITLDRKTNDNTLSEVEFCISATGLEHKLSVLDVGAGMGRHSISLGKLGHKVTSIEKSEEYTEEALKRAAAAGIELDWLKCDLRDFNIHETFDLAISLYTSFGYHTDEENQYCLNNIANALRPGGVFVLDMTSRDAVCREAVEVKSTPWDSDGRCEKHNDFNLLTSRRTLNWYFYRGNDLIKTVSLQHRLYSLHELVHSFKQSGLDVVSAYSDFDKAPITHSDRKIVLVGRKR